MLSSSPVPTTASTSGIFFRISSRKRSTRHPATTNFFAFPALCRAISRIVLTDSCCALSMNEQVFTTMTSASSARWTRSAPACESMPIITSLSTRFLGQPKLTKPTLGAAGLDSSGVSTDEDFEGMQSFNFITLTGCSWYQLIAGQFRLSFPVVSPGYLRNLLSPGQRE